MEKIEEYEARIPPQTEDVDPDDVRTVPVVAYLTEAEGLITHKAPECSWEWVLVHRESGKRLFERVPTRIICLEIAKRIAWLPWDRYGPVEMGEYWQTLSEGTKRVYNAPTSASLRDYLEKLVYKALRGYL